MVFHITLNHGFTQKSVKSRMKLISQLQGGEEPLVASCNPRNDIVFFTLKLILHYMKVLGHIRLFWLGSLWWIFVSHS